MDILYDDEISHDIGECFSSETINIKFDLYLDNLREYRNNLNDRYNSDKCIEDIDEIFNSDFFMNRNQGDCINIDDIINNDACVILNENEKENLLLGGENKCDITYMNNELLYKIYGFPKNNEFLLENKAKVETFREKTDIFKFSNLEECRIKDYKMPQYFNLKEEEFEEQFKKSNLNALYGKIERDDTGFGYVVHKKDFTFDIVEAYNSITIKPYTANIAFNKDYHWFFRSKFESRLSKAYIKNFTLSSEKEIIYLQKAIVISPSQFAIRFYYVNIMEELFGMLFPLIKVIQKHPDMKIITSYENHIFDQWLSVFNISHDRVIPLTMNSINKAYFVENLLTPESQIFNLPHPYLIHYSRSKIFDALQLNHLASNEDIILVINRIARGPNNDRNNDGIPRQIPNHDELMISLRETFPDETFVEFDGSLNQIETARLFNKAKIIIAPHGAGSANIAFSPKNCFVIEIHCKMSSPVYLSFYSIATSIGMGYLTHIPEKSYHNKPFTTLKIEDVILYTRLALQGFQTLNTTS
eukprot:TRINITY_DN16522_c0_g1_i1.p1 TRINITY_DN16522_c0_g1~~TRINITY_DN16522_c0_g1_i1.p1  ORF type:complete len:529 (+),score=89.46 TRINITY_DN16522_c0_g1_i1:35-1621(+)